MKRSLTVLFVLLMLTVAASSDAFAQENTHRCTDLPPIAWDSTSPAKVRIVVDITLPRVTSAKELYLNAMCGAQPAAVWDLVLRGEGGILEVPRPLSDALDKAVPYMPRVDYMYVRGGGEDREVIVILFANGYEGPIFEIDHGPNEFPWQPEMVSRAADVWNGLPYEVMRHASHWLHDAALFEDHYTVNLELLNGLIEIPVFTQQGGRGLAAWIGTMFTSAGNTHKSLGFWAHEMGHYVDFDINGVNQMAYGTDEHFGAISFENNRILGVEIPFWFRLKHDEAAEWRDAHGGCENSRNWSQAPWGFATAYGMCGELGPVEDFADSLVLAMGETQEIRESGYHSEPWEDYEIPYYQPDRFYDRTGDSDASIMAEKIGYIYDRLKIHATLPQDADGDGVTYTYGHTDNDCSDINPVDGQCDTSGCSSDTECDDGEACTVDLCRQGECVHDIRDSDGDGSPDAACGGSDCADHDPTIKVGSVRDCTGACNIAGEQQCVAGGWTECSAPNTCDCDPSAPPEIIPCGNCGTKELHCRPDGTWAQPTACEPLDPAADGCSPGDTRTSTSSCSARTCAGRSIPREREETCNAQCNWEETQACTLTEATTAEVCNGFDDDCDLDTDEGCIDALTFVGQAPQSLIMGDYPYGDGYPNETNCPAGQALVGFRLTEATYSDPFSSYQILGSVKPLCKDVELSSVLTGGEYQYAVTTGSAITELETHGKYDTFHTTYMCPDGEVVRGIRVKQGWFIDRIKVHCGELDVSGSIGSYTLDRHNGASSGIMVSGTELDTSQHCTGDGLATGLRTQTGDAVDGIGLNCSDVTLQLK